MQQWSFSVQRQLPKDMVASLAYVGSKGTHLSAELQSNQLSAPPVGPDTGIFTSGNPFNPGQPLTIDGECASFQNNHFLVNNIPIAPPQPAFNNLAAACFGARDLIIRVSNEAKSSLPMGLVRWSKAPRAIGI